MYFSKYLLGGECRRYVVSVKMLVGSCRKLHLISKLIVAIWMHPSFL